MSKETALFENHKLTLTHLNIRQSIAIMLIKIVLADIILALIMIGFYFLLIQSGNYTNNAISNPAVFLISFTLIGVFKIGLSIYIVLEWLNEYYEITPEAVIHKRGVIIRRSEKYNLDKVRAMEVEDSFFGELMNFATITLYDIRLNKYLDMYLIHNPKRYAQILHTLRPHLELKSDRIKLPFMSKSVAIDGEEE
jgi:hypothetical protein